MDGTILCTRMCCCRRGRKTLRDGSTVKRERVPGIRCRCSNLGVEVASPAARKSPAARCSRPQSLGTWAGRQRKGPTSVHSTGQSHRASFELVNLTQLPAPLTVVIKPRVTTLYSLTPSPNNAEMASRNPQ